MREKSIYGWVTFGGDVFVLGLIRSTPCGSSQGAAFETEFCGMSPRRWIPTKHKAG